MAEETKKPCKCPYCDTEIKRAQEDGLDNCNKNKDIRASKLL